MFFSLFLPLSLPFLITVTLLTTGRMMAATVINRWKDGCSGNELLLPDGIPWKGVCTGLGRRYCKEQERSVTFMHHILLIDSISDHNNGLGEFTSSFLLRLPIQHKLPHFKQFTSPAALEEKRQKEIDCGNHERFSEKVTRTTNRW